MFKLLALFKERTLNEWNKIKRNGKKNSEPNITKKLSSSLLLSISLKIISLYSYDFSLEVYAIFI